MAQIAEERNRKKRMALLVRQRPGLIIAIAVVCGLVLGSAAFGVMQASGGYGFELQRDDGFPNDVLADVEVPDDGPRSAGETSDGDAAREADAERVRIVVDVSGAVVRPAVVELYDGDRVQDAIEAAGGLTEDAEVSGVNRAAKLVDGQQVYIPREGEMPPAAGATGAAGPTVGSTAGSAALVNINTATVTELDELPGVGPSTAQAIVDERAANGSFATIEDLMRVTGIGEKKFAKLKPLICV